MANKENNMDQMKMDDMKNDHQKMSDMQNHMQSMNHDDMKMAHEMSSTGHQMKMDHGSMNMSGMDHGHMDMSNDMDMAGGDVMMHGGSMMHMGNLKVKFWVSVVLAIPVLLLAPIMGLNISIINLNAPLAVGIVIVLFDSALYFYGGMPFLKGAVAEIKDKSPEMMTLVTLGISVSYFYSLYAFVANNFLNPANHVMDFSFELATLILIMLLGHWIEMNA